MPAHEKIDYVEYPAHDLEATQTFFQAAFGWSFDDYGPDYAAFSGQGVDGGFFRSDMAASTDRGSALIIFYSERLEDTLAKVTAAGARIVRPIYAFPGGRRFHFTEPSGNEFAVWSEPEASPTSTFRPGSPSAPRCWCARTPGPRSWSPGSAAGLWTPSRSC